MDTITENEQYLKDLYDSSMTELINKAEFTLKDLDSMTDDQIEQLSNYYVSNNDNIKNSKKQKKHKHNRSGSNEMITVIEETDTLYNGTSQNVNDNNNNSNKNKKNNSKDCEFEIDCDETDPFCEFDASKSYHNFNDWYNASSTKKNEKKKKKGRNKTITSLNNNHSNSSRDRRHRSSRRKQNRSSNRSKSRSKHSSRSKTRRMRTSRERSNCNKKASDSLRRSKAIDSSVTKGIEFKFDENDSNRWLASPKTGIDRSTNEHEFDDNHSLSLSESSENKSDEMSDNGSEQSFSSAASLLSLLSDNPNDSNMSLNSGLELNNNNSFHFEYETNNFNGNNGLQQSQTMLLPLAPNSDMTDEFDESNNDNFVENINNDNNNNNNNNNNVLISRKDRKERVLAMNSNYKTNFHEFDSSFDHYTIQRQKQLAKLNIKISNNNYATFSSVVPTLAPAPAAAVSGPNPSQISPRVGIYNNTISANDVFCKVDDDGNKAS